MKDFVKVFLAIIVIMEALIVIASIWTGVIYLVKIILVPILSFFFKM